jgi:hypothetical protein
MKFGYFAPMINKIGYPIFHFGTTLNNKTLLHSEFGEMEVHLFDIIGRPEHKITQYDVLSDLEVPGYLGGPVIVLGDFCCTKDQEGRAVPSSHAEHEHVNDLQFEAMGKLARQMAIDILIGKAFLPSSISRKSEHTRYNPIAKFVLHLRRVANIGGFKWYNIFKLGRGSNTEIEVVFSKRPVPEWNLRHFADQDRFPLNSWGTPAYYQFFYKMWAGVLLWSVIRVILQNVWIQFEHKVDVSRYPRIGRTRSDLHAIVVDEEPQVDYVHQVIKQFAKTLRGTHQSW